MPIQPCPACGQQTPRHLHQASEEAFVNYYICPDCGHIWNLDKLDPSKLTHVTPLRLQRKTKLE